MKKATYHICEVLSWFGFWAAVAVMLAAVALLLSSCVTSERLAPGGAYAASATQTAQPELFTVDASFDLAVAALDTVFKYERDNRAVLWKLSPDIKHGLDQLRVQAVLVKKDYAVGRQAYLASPSPINLSALQAALAKLQGANAAALAILQTKGIK